MRSIAILRSFRRAAVVFLTSFTVFSIAIADSSSAAALQVQPDSEPVTVSTAAILQRDHSPSESRSEDAAIPPSYSSRFWETGSGASENVIHAIAQTGDGILWVGTAGGLARFDGEQFEFISIPSTNSPGRHKINAMCSGSDGALWVGTAGQGLFCLQDGAWKSFPLSDLDGNILALHRMSDGSIWIGTRNGMARWHNEQISPRRGDNDAFAGPEKNAWTATVRGIVQDAAGDLWIGAGDHLMQLHDGAVTADFALPEFNPTYFRSICYRRDGNIWLGSNSGLTRFKDGKFTHFAKSNGLPDNVVSVIFEDRRDNLWIGTSGGLCRFAGGKFVVETTSDGEVYDQIYSIFEDRENNLWVGAKNGLYQLRVQQFTTYTTRHGLAHNNVTSMCEERDGTMWIGTWGGGLHRIQGEKTTIYSSAKTKTLRNDLILAMQPAADGGIWFSTDFDGGLYRVKDDELKRYASAEGFDPTAVRAFMTDSFGRLIVGTARESVYVFENGSFSRNADGFNLPSRDIRCLLESKDGCLWVGTETALFCRSNRTFVAFTTTNGLPDNFIHSLHEDGEGSLWIGTARGLSRLRGGTNFKSYGRSEGLFDDTIVEILEDDSRNLWLASRQGVFRISIGDFGRLDAGDITAIPATIFGKADGMISPVCVAVAKPSALKSRDGRLWFATTKGIAVTDPRFAIAKNKVPPSVVIRGVVANKIDVTAGRWQLSPVSASAIRIAPGRGELEFQYQALSYTDPEKNRFKYRLKGFDVDWVDAGTRRSAFYNSVPPGSYEFQVIACNNDGTWNETGSSLKLTLQPHYWQTSWFRGIMALGAFGMVAGTARYATRRRLEVQLQRLEQQHAIEKERTRIAQDMHDELGARLTEIRVLSQLTEHKKDQPQEVEAQSKRISDATGELIRNLHSIVWAVNPANDSLEKLADYICGYAQPFVKGASIRCRLERPDVLPNVKLSSEVRHSIVMAIKEALNNTIKHAEASEVRIMLTVIGSRLAITIADNGKSFEPNQTLAAGNGLQNMERRMRSIDGSCQVLTELGKGTTIRFEIPLKDVATN